MRQFLLRWVPASCPLMRLTYRAWWLSQAPNPTLVRGLPMAAPPVFLIDAIAGAVKSFFEWLTEREKRRRKRKWWWPWGRKKRSWWPWSRK